MSLEILEQLVDEFKLGGGDNADYFGEISGHPAILTILSGYPLTVMFKIRVNSNDTHEIVFPDELAGLAAEEKINVSVENGYAWLTIYELADLNIPQTRDILDAFLTTIESFNLRIGPACVVCQDNSSADVYYHGGNINRLCANCLEAKEQQRRAVENKFIDINGASALLTVLGVFGFAFLWMLMWLAYDLMFVLAGSDSVEIPHLVLGIGGLVIILSLAATLGLPLRRMHIRQPVLLGVISSFLAIVSFLIGEFFQVIVELYREAHAFNLFGCLHFTVIYWMNPTSVFQIVKVGIMIAVIVGIFFIARQEKATLDL